MAATVVRAKYRPNAIQPELSAPTVGASLSLANKKKPVVVDPYAEIKRIVHEEPVFVINKTQHKRVEVVVFSDEEKYRRSVKPTIFERVAMQKERAQDLLQEARVAREKEALKKMIDDMKEKQRARMRAQAEAAEERKRSRSWFSGVKRSSVNSETKVSGDEDEDFEGFQREGESLEGDGVGEEEEDDVLDMETGEQHEHIEDDGLDAGDEEEGQDQDERALKLKQYMLEIKEKKILATRNNSMHHRAMSNSDIRKIAFKIRFGFFTKNKDFTEILPWLLLGRKDISTNAALLMRLGITHILNVSEDLPMLFPQRFVYKRVSVADNIEANIGRHFSSIAEFIRRVEMGKGRIFVHCSIGTSRAPSAVMAYLIAEKKLPLVDAFTYVTTLRPHVLPNRHFLYQLAEWELEQLGGTSVLYHKEWRFYEYNTLRARGLEALSSLGLGKTVWQLYTMTEADELSLA